MKLYICGHATKRGYGISRSWSPKECSELPPSPKVDDLNPLRFIKERGKAFALVARYNRRFATH